VSENENENQQGWFQCTQCGHGHWVQRWEVEIGDYVERTACPECGIGIMKVEWEENAKLD
jgi:hypothetical protein